MSERPPKKLKTATDEMPPDNRYTPDDLVTLLVGPEEQKFVVYGHLIVMSSEFFKAALKKEWIEGQTRTVKLPEESPKTMACYLDFVYGKGLLSDAFDSYSSLVSTDELTDRNVYEEIVDLYLLGERNLDDRTRNAVLRELTRFFSFRND